MDAQPSAGLLSGAKVTWVQVTGVRTLPGTRSDLPIGCTTVQTVAMVAGACFGATKSQVVCFSVERIFEPIAIPDICGHGHLLTPDNLKVDRARRRWRCRRCSRMRAAEFRARHEPAA